jgi:replicative DNA helicase
MNTQVTSYSNSLKILNSAQGADRAIEYIKKRQSGEITSLKTSFEKFNKAILNGVDWNRILTIGGLSGGGKSTFLEQLRNDFYALNDEKFYTLSFEFEMVMQDILAKSASSAIDKSVKEIYSAFEPLSDADFLKVERHIKESVSERKFYVDTTGTVSQIVNTILEFVALKNLSETGEGIVVCIDHVLLTKSKLGEAEKAVIDNLMQSLVELKKHFATVGVRSLFLILSQLNRNLEDADRIATPSLHYPNRNDIFAASSVFYCSDYVIVLHRPATLTGIGKGYGPPKEKFKNGLPIRGESGDMVYLHILKERFGKTGIIALEENFKFSKLKEVNL